MLHLLILGGFLFVLVPEATCTVSEGFGFRINLTHVDTAGNFTRLELLQRSLKRGAHRKESLASLTAADQVEAPVHAGTGEFLIDLTIGTPHLTFSAILDTGSDLIWTQCKPCKDCYKQSTPIFDPSKSSTFSKLSCSSPLCNALPTSTCNPDCEYLYSYGDYSSSQGVLARETFTFGSVSIPKIGFGCGESNQGSGFKQGSGLVGLGRGPLSLISQLGLGKFSYCLTGLSESKKSPLMFGSLANFNASQKKQVHTTPLVKNPSQSSFYYLTLKDITVGSTRLKIPAATFALQEDGTGGLIIDSGTSITYLEEKGYKLLKKAFKSQMNLPEADGSDIGLDLCFSQPSDVSPVEVPGLTFHFDGADLALPEDNYMVADSKTSLLCVAILGSSGMSIFGNLQQQNMHILYDLKNEKLSIMPVKCDQL